MQTGNLSPLQQRVLGALAGISPPWTLTGGGAIVGFYAPYRLTRDLDLFWRGLGQISEDLERQVVDRLILAGIVAERSRRAPSFARFDVREGAQSCVLDLVADPAPSLFEPARAELGGHGFLVDTLQELAVNKLVALLSRHELRDLADLRELERHGVDLGRALLLAPKKEGGFSVMTPAWVLSNYPWERYKADVMLRPEALSGLREWRDDFIADLRRRSDPGDCVWERP